MIKEQTQKAWTFKIHTKSLHLTKGSLHRLEVEDLLKLKKQHWQKIKFQHTSKRHNQTPSTHSSRLRADTTACH
jgi:hypothetical protein